MASLASLCTARIIRSYYADGILPPKNTFCEPDEMPFTDIRSSELPPLNQDDITLLQQLKALRQEIHGHHSTSTIPEERVKHPA
jgi:hypothetical protein